MENTSAALLKKLSALAQLDIDAVGAYEKAIEHIEEVEIKDQIIKFKADHQRHFDDLSAHIMELNGHPPEAAADFKGLLIKGVTALRSMTGTKGALKAMQSNEELTNKTYDEALNDDTLPEDTRRLLIRNRNDERRHLEYIKSVLEMPVEIEE